MTGARADILAELAAQLPALLTPVLAKLSGAHGVDAQRQARCDWFRLHALTGKSVLAARVLIGGTTNTGSNEIPMYEDAIHAVDAAVPDVMAKARAAGQYWDTTDNAESSLMRAAVTADLPKPKAKRKRAKAKKKAP